MSSLDKTSRISPYRKSHFPIFHINFRADDDLQFFLLLVDELKHACSWSAMKQANKVHQIPVLFPVISGLKHVLVYIL